MPTAETDPDGFLPGPRPLTAREREVLDLLLSVEFPGVAELRVQAKSATVAERLRPMWITFDVDPDLPRAFTVCRVPVDAHVTGDQGGEVLLFVGDGQLDTMEFNTYDASMLTRGQWELPPAASFGRPTANPPNPDYIANSRGEAAH